MGNMFDVAELVRVAVEDEKAGVSFYSALAQKAQSPQLREIFADLAEQERHHQKRFQEMLDSLGDYQSPERYSGEYTSYLNALTTDRAFPDADQANKAAQACKDDASAVELASRFERDTLILMTEMRKLVPEKDQAIVDELADEERGHLVTLSAASKKLGGTAPEPH